MFERAPEAMRGDVRERLNRSGRRQKDCDFLEVEQGFGYYVEGGAEGVYI